jgi:hypothetical protein
MSDRDQINQQANRLHRSWNSPNRPSFAPCIPHVAGMIVVEAAQ